MRCARQELDRTIDALDMALDALNDARLAISAARQPARARALLEVYNTLIDQRRALCGARALTRKRGKYLYKVIWADGTQLGETLVRAYDAPHAEYLARTSEDWRLSRGVLETRKAVS